LAPPIRISAAGLASAFVLAAVAVAHFVRRQRLLRLRAEEAAARLATSEARYRSLVEATTQITLHADEHGLDVGLSPGWLELTGQPPEAARGAGWLACVHPDDRAGVEDAWRRAIDGRTEFEREFRLRDAIGGYRTMSVRSLPVRDAEGRVREWIGAGTDVTQARAVDQLARIRARQQLEVADLGRHALLGASVDELLEHALRIVVDTLGADMAAALELLPAQAALVLRASHGWEEAPIGSGTAPADESLAGLTLAADGPVVSDDVRNDPRFEPSPLLRETGAVSAVAVVVRGKPHRWGVLGVFSETPRRFSVDDASFVRSVANVLASSLERSSAEEAVRASEARLQLALEAGQLGTWDRSLLTGSLSWSPAVEDAFGLEPGSFGGTDEAFYALVHPEDVDRVKGALAVALAGDEPYDTEYRCVRPDGTVAWISSQGQVLRDAAGVPVRMVGLSRDVTERKHWEESLAFLAEASEVLSSSLDHERTLAEIARLAVPRLADCCIVDVVESERGTQQVALVHVDPEQERRILALETRYPTDTGESYVGRVLAARSAMLVSPADEAFLTDVARDADHLRELRALGLCSALFAPLIARGRTIGMITLLTDRSGRRLGPEDMVLATDLARHAALAVDNARLYRQRSHVASTLQRSLLPPKLPHVSGIELAARYRAVGRGLEVGGDFYDVFALGEDSYGIVIGDVCGKGPEAAAMTGLARHTIRAAALHTDSPADVLARLNESVFGEYDGSTFCTVAYARIEPGTTHRRLRLVSGGHPLPLRLHADGKVEPIGRFGTLVGIFPDAGFEDVDVRLEPGDAVLLYTDGLADGLGGHLVPGEEHLLALLSGCVGRDAEEIATAIEDAVAGAGEAADRDDIAFLVVRIVA
jgi:PAS domain S-box-containing protein